MVCCVGLVALLSSCATVFNRNKQAVTINTNAPRAKVVVDLTDTVNAGEPFRISRRDTHLIEVVAPGYDHESFYLRRKLSPAVYLNLVLMPVSIGLGIPLFNASTSEAYVTPPFGTVTITREDETRNAIGASMMIYSWVLPFLPTGIDALTGKMWKFDEEVSLKMSPIPEPFDASEVKAIQLSEFRSAVQRGDRVGTFHARGPSFFDEEIDWLSYMNVDMDSLESNMETRLHGNGIPRGDISNELSTSDAPLSWVIDIEEIEYDIYRERRFKYRTECAMKARMRVIDRAENLIVYESHLEASSFTQRNGGAEVVYTCANRLVDAMLADRGFRESILK